MRAECGTKLTSNYLKKTESRLPIKEINNIK